MINWSETAKKIFLSKYPVSGIPLSVEDHPDDVTLPKCLRRGIAAKGSAFGSENTIRQVLHRVASLAARFGLQQGYFDSTDDAAEFYKLILGDMINQRAMPNSPQLFNTGIMHAYGIAGEPLGHWHSEPNTGEVVLSTDSNTFPQVAACYILPVEDALFGDNSITQLWTDETRLYKMGSGTGSNYSKIREKNAPLSGGGVSSGVMSFLEVGDSVAGSMRSGGASRRAARMIILDHDHPDIEEFISWKSIEEEKVRALTVGYSSIGEDEFIENMPELNSAWQGAAYATVSGQNGNNTIRVSNEFMRRYRDDETYSLISRYDGSETKSVSAQIILRSIAENAWITGDPGIHFSDTINASNTCKNDGEIRSSNPCSEVLFLDGSACNLASINLEKLFNQPREGQGFNFRELSEITIRWIRFLDISVGLGQYPTKQTAQSAHDYRLIGLGFANLGGLLLRSGLPYDSKEARELAKAIMLNMQTEAVHFSSYLAAKLGAFPAYQRNKESVLKTFVEQTGFTNVTFSHTIYVDDVLTEIKPGFRNAQLTAIAPTGTIGLIMDCLTTGIEPMFGLRTYKTTVEGEIITLAHPAVAASITGYFRNHYDYDCSEKECLNSIERHGELPQNAPSELKKLLQTASGDNALSASAHLKMMSAVQPHVSGAISKTINLPNSATVDDVLNVYLEAHKLKLKAVAVYRDGCKLSQPLSTKKQKPPRKEILSFSANRKKLPNMRGGYTRKMIIGGQKLYLRTGEYEDGSLGEIFITTPKQGSTLRSLLDLWATTFSIALQYGVPLLTLIDTFSQTKFEPNGFVEEHSEIKFASSIADLIMRELQMHYLNEKMTSSENTINYEQNMPQYTGDFCASCESHRMRRAGSCSVCEACGTSSGCS